MKKILLTIFAVVLAFCSVGLVACADIFHTCVYDQEVANALFNAVEKWAKEKGMDEVVGPLGFSDLEREGLLIEGFDEIATFEEQYNFAYYQKLIENLGYEKEIDWVERKVYLPDEEDHRLEKLYLIL
jgi:hypothetical protein